MAEEALKKALQQALSSLDSSIEDIHLEHPADFSHGDYSSNVALVLSKKAQSNPRELAQRLVSELEKDDELKNIVSKIEIAGPGFINFWLDHTWLVSEAAKLQHGKISFPAYHLGENHRILIEFAHFNTHKAVHIGHMRNITLGESLSRIFEALDNTVIRLSYGGDVGMHIAKCLYGLKQLNKNPQSLEEKTELLAEAYAAGNNAFEDDEDAKKEIIALNKKIYQSDPEIADLWSTTKKWSLDQFEQIYTQMDTRFDRCYYESDVFERGLELSREALEKGILVESDGAIIFDGEKYGLDKRVFITSEGNPTYEGKELGIAETEFTKHGSIDRAIHVVAPEQKSFFDVTFKVEEMLSPELYMNRQYHYAYGYVRLTSGKMSSRKGTIIKGQWLLDEIKRTIQESFPEMDSAAAQIVAVAAVKYSFIKIDARQDISFDINQSISIDGNSGPYLLYAYARCVSILDKAGVSSKVLGTYSNIVDEEQSILRTLYKYPPVVHSAGKNFAPHLIANYLHDLAQKYNLFYQKVPILKSSDEEKKFRLALTKAVSNVLKNGLSLLGIQTLEKM